MICDVQIQFEDHVSVYRIEGQELIESLLRMSDLDEIADTIFLNGTIISDTEGDIFLDLSGFERDVAAGEFQNGLFDFVNDIETDEAFNQ